jgi:two-component system response regulator HydG
MVGDSPVMRTLAKTVARTARTSLPTLILGETGTGKELVARALHELSGRRHGPYVALNASMLSGDLGTSQLFGHAAGAFTGATTPRSGALREASRGTLFLDELGSLPSESQAKLLRVLEDAQVQPLGSDRSYAVDLRIVAATCEPLDRLVAIGQFRRDLYERLATCILRVPSLRERPSDIPHLARALLARSELDRYRLSSAALEHLSKQSYPGNVRELRNIVLRAAVLADATVVDVADVDVALSLQRATFETQPGPANEDAMSLWRQSNGNVSQAARKAGLPRSTFRDRLKRALEPSA